MFPIPVALWNAQVPLAIQASAGALAFTGQPPSLVTTGLAAFPSAGALAITRLAPTVTSTITNIARTPSPRALAIIGEQPSLDISGDQLATPAARALAITRNPPTVTVTAPLAFFVNGALSNSSNTNPFTYTVVNSIPAGRLVVVMIGTRGNTTISAVSDSRGNSYTVDCTTVNTGHLVAGGIAHSRITTGLTPGNTIIITMGANLNGGAGAIVGSVANTQASPFDRAASAFGTGSLPTASTSVTSNARDIVFGLLLNDNRSVNQAPGYTTINAGPPAGPGGSVVFASNNCLMVAGYKIISSTGVQTYTPTMNSSGDWVDCIAAYKGI